MYVSIWWHDELSGVGIRVNISQPYCCRRAPERAAAITAGKPVVADPIHSLGFPAEDRRVVLLSPPLTKIGWMIMTPFGRILINLSRIYLSRTIGRPCACKVSSLGLARR